MKHIILLILFFIVPVSYTADTADTANRQQDADRNINLNFNLGLLTGEEVYIMLKNRRRTGLIFVSIEKGQLTDTGLVIANFERVQSYLQSGSIHLSIQTDSGKPISSQVSIKHISLPDNMIVLESTYNLQALEQEMAIVQQEYDEAQKEWQEADDTLKPQIEALKEQKFAHLENAKKILEIITQL